MEVGERYKNKAPFFILSADEEVEAAAFFCLFLIFVCSPSFICAKDKLKAGGGGAHSNASW